MERNKVRNSFDDFISFYHSFALKVCRRFGGINSGMPNAPARLSCAVGCPLPGTCRFTVKILGSQPPLFMVGPEGRHGGYCAWPGGISSVFSCISPVWNSDSSSAVTAFLSFLHPATDIANKVHIIGVTIGWLMFTTPWVT